MPGDKLFLDVDAMGDDEDPLGQVGASQADLPDPRHAQPAWKQCWRKAIAKARVKLADKSWKDKSWKVTMKDLILTPTLPPILTLILTLTLNIGRWP